MWWQAPVIPATQDAEAGEMPESGGRGCSELRSRHCILAWATKRDSVSKKKAHMEVHLFERVGDSCTLLRLGLETVNNRQRCFVLLYIFETRSCSVAQAGMQCCKHGSVQPRLSGLK